ncbi:MAG: asparagine synthase (glutamine-hydrolyzing) [Gemmatimonadota bacterium]|nr:asparagine synthase (glutamine-hydrolyzing) [Gemmatimonadota bacterium]
MCGISGLLGGPPNLALPDDRQRHRGPDDSGSYADPRRRASLWFRRLSILDLSGAGHQPMSNEDGTVWLVFNGEIYNFRPLREQLERAGHVFRSRTDSEVLVHLWEEHGRDMLRHLNGMFAFCIWDERRGEAFLARDHAGIKPLYLATSGRSLAFASEAKVLLALPSVDRSVEPLALRQYLTFLWVPGERTMWRGISRLPAGGWLSWTPEKTEHGIWWDWDQSAEEERSPEEWTASVRETLLESVERQLMSDVPLGALVSGGLDSSAIAGAMRHLHPDAPIRSYTAALQGDAQDGFASDIPYAEQVGRFLGLDLVTEQIEPAIAGLLPMLIWQCDEPLADPAIAASFLLCRRARADGTIVLLSGQGADELYHGYRSHRAMHLARRVAGVPRPLVRVASAIGESIAARSGISATAAPRRMLKMLRFVGAPLGDRILQLADWSSTATRDALLQPAARSESTHDVYGDYLELFERSRARNDVDRWSYVLFKTFLPALNLTYGDRTSMAVSVELRVPFLDRALVEQAGRIPAELKMRDGRQKWVLGEAARPWLPAQILTRPKTGFGAPLRRWLATDLHGLMRDVLLGERMAARGLFVREGVEQLLADLETGRRDVAYIVWALFTFELWARTFVDGDGDAPVAIGA